VAEISQHLIPFQKGARNLCLRIDSKLKESLSAIHNQNVIHKDPAPRNWLYNPESKKVVIFDFEGAEMLNTRPILSLISPNRKRKRTAIDGSDKKSLSTGFAQEINKAVRELRGFRLPRFQET
jgi:serine/threonine protein kinase